MKIELERLVKIADNLDRAGKSKEADLLDGVIQKIAGDIIDFDQYKKKKEEAEKEENKKLIPVKDFLIKALDDMLVESTISIQVNEAIKSDFHKIQDSLSDLVYKVGTFGEIDIESEDAPEKILDNALEIQDGLKTLFPIIENSLNLLADSIQAQKDFDHIKEGLDQAIEGIENILERGESDVE